MIIPYRVKNPIKRFPAVTYSLIAINIAVFFQTIGPNLGIREDVVLRWGAMMKPDFPARFVASLFLHANIAHILGNLLFLYVFGPPVEDRIGPLNYILLYFGSGICGDLLQAVIGGGLVPTIGASGAIMGVLGAYWHMYSWSPVCVWYWFWIFFHGKFEINAIWLIGLYIATDLLLGILGGDDGIAHFAHLGGAAFGLLVPCLLRIKRDNAEVSKAKALQSDAMTLEELPLEALEDLLNHSPDDCRIFAAFALIANKTGHSELIGPALKRSAGVLIEQCPATVAAALIDLKAAPDSLIPKQYLRLAGMLSSEEDRRSETQALQLLLSRYPDCPEAESALFRLGKLYCSVWNDRASGRKYLEYQLQKFPDGSLADYARSMLEKL